MKNFEVSTEVNNNVKTVSDKVTAICSLVRTELLTNRNVIATLYDNRNDETLKEFAEILFADCENLTRKLAIIAGLKRYTKLFPYAICIRYSEKNIDYKCARMEQLAHGVYKAKEIGVIDTLEAVLFNYYNGGKSIGVEANFYYDEEGNVIDSALAKKQIEKEADLRRTERNIKKGLRNAKIVADTDFDTLIIAAINKAPTDNIREQLEEILKGL